MKLKELGNSELMMGISLSMNQVIVHVIIRENRCIPTSEQIQPGDKLLFSAAKQSEVRIAVDEDLRDRLNRCLIWADGNLTLDEDLCNVSRFLDQRRMMDEGYTITKGSIITQVDTEEDQILPHNFHERLSQHMPIDARVTVSFNPLHRWERHVTNIEKSPCIPVWNQVRLIQNQVKPSRVGPETDVLPGLDFLRNTGLPLTYQLDDQDGSVSLVGPTTQVSQSKAQFLIFCDFYDDVSLIHLSGLSQRMDPAALQMFQQNLRPLDKYAPCLQELARDDNRDMADVLSALSLWSPVPSGTMGQMPEDFGKDLDDLIATFGNIPPEVRCRILYSRTSDLQGSSPELGKDFQPNCPSYLAYLHATDVMAEFQSKVQTLMSHAQRMGYKCELKDAQLFLHKAAGSVDEAAMLLHESKTKSRWQIAVVCVIVGFAACMALQKARGLFHREL